MKFSDGENLCKGYIKKDFRMWEGTGRKFSYEASGVTFRKSGRLFTVEGRGFDGPHKVCDLSIRIQGGDWFLNIVYADGNETKDLRIPLEYGK